MRWDGELTTNEADPDDRALSGALATVTGKLRGKALTGNDKLTSESLTTVTDEDEILSELPTVEGLLSGSPTVTDKIISESPTKDKLELQNPGRFWTTNFRGFLNILSRSLQDLVGRFSPLFVI